jgi:hypothetical protein
VRKHADTARACLTNSKRDFAKVPPGESRAAAVSARQNTLNSQWYGDGMGVAFRLAALAAGCLLSSQALADLRITRDHGGEVTRYKEKYQRIRDSGERVIIDGICNSACTLVLGIVPHNRICVTPRARLGFHEAYTVQNWPFRTKVASASGTADLMSYYPEPVLDWIARAGGLTPKMKIVKNGPELWSMVLPCPEEW